MRQSEVFVAANTIRDFTGKSVLVTGGATGTCRKRCYYSMKALNPNGTCRSGQSAMASCRS